MDKELIAELVAVLGEVNHGLAMAGRIEVGSAIACRVSEVLAHARADKGPA